MRGRVHRSRTPETRINSRVRAPEVRLIDVDGSQLGLYKTSEALKRAQDAGVDLVEVAPNAVPPVCRLFAVVH